MWPFLRFKSVQMEASPSRHRTSPPLQVLWLRLSLARKLFQKFPLTFSNVLLLSDIPHSVTQSSGLDAPCTPASGGFSSGLTQGGNTFSINITDASTRELQSPYLLISLTCIILSAIYFFCEFPAHCGEGMVGYVN